MLDQGLRSSAEGLGPGQIISWLPCLDVREYDAHFHEDEQHLFPINTEGAFRE
jgi:hypothetical protein